MATLSPDQPERRRPRNRGFAKAARNFAKWVAALPGIVRLTASGLAAIVLATITGAFGTIAMAYPARFGFWSLLIGWNIAKWIAWFAWRVRRPRDWRRAAAIGALLINLPLPLEIPLALRLFGVSTAIDPARTWIEAAAISVTLFVALFLARRAGPAKAVIPADTGILFRAGIRDLADVHGLRAEDHYCRVHLADGRTLLVLARFADLRAELAGIDGEQVHRGAWVAAAGMNGAVRDRRAWRLVLSDGTRLPVSETYLAVVRARGWLKIKPKLGVA
ncbi:LytTR family DNA-binding domain-containing protein [Sphingomonas asaccharolytica]|uniref:LytTR family DNA-binding domain-containing protein n=1 Tax=Sphingomonas asaccharolytica TaxID=40681 RepID=UPI0008378DEC|nr:LytTR family DNA-binding domain-containing protein [Sphingomonas asaccharolytica]